MISIQPLQLNWPMPCLAVQSVAYALALVTSPARAQVASPWRETKSGASHLPRKHRGIATCPRELPPTPGPIRHQPAHPHFSVTQKDFNLGPAKKSPSPTIPSLPDPPPPSASIPSPPLILRSPFIPFQFRRSIPSSHHQGQSLSAIQSNTITPAHTQPQLKPQVQTLTRRRKIWPTRGATPSLTRRSPRSPSTSTWRTSRPWSWLPTSCPSPPPLTAISLRWIFA
jgi:hypothetical protein